MAERMDDDVRISGRTDPYPSTGGASGATGDDTDNPAAIRADIRETRDRLGETLEEIGDRLNPRHLTEQVKENIRDATVGRVENMARNAADRVNETRYSIMDMIRDNPIPAAMIGIGLGWLLINRKRQDSTSSGTQGSYGTYGTAGSYRGAYAGAGAGFYDAGTATPYAGAPYGGTADYDDDRPGAMDRARERASHLGHDARDTAGNVASRARETASNVGDSAQHAARQVADRAQDAAHSVASTSRRQAQRVESTFYEQPLVVGAATLALGLAAGLAIPGTDRESELMGSARDRVVDKVRDAAHDARERVETVVERVTEEAKDTAREAAREEGLTSNA